MIKSEGLVLTMSGREPRFSGEVSERSHKNMSHIKGKDTSIEIILRKALWSRGYRYRKNYKNLPGRPDLAITKYKIAIFCDSEFFHGKRNKGNLGQIIEEKFLKQNYNIFKHEISTRLC